MHSPVLPYSSYTMVITEITGGTISLRKLRFYEITWLEIKDAFSFIFEDLRYGYR
jgi:hypothetical protein